MDAEDAAGPSSRSLPIVQLDMRIPDVNVKYEKDRPVPPHCPKLFFIGAIVGSRGSGKTHAMIQLMQMYNASKTFDKTYVICPTYDSDPKYKLFETLDTQLTVHREFNDAIWAEVEEEIQGDLDEYDAYVERLAIWKKAMNPKQIETLSEDEYAELERTGFEKPSTRWKHGKPTSVLILDDLVGSSLYRADCKGRFNSWAIRHRHARTAVIFLAQVWANAVPRQLRANLSLALLFRCKNTGITKEIASEFSSYVSIEDFQAMWDQATAEDHGFLLCDFESPKGEQMRIGFDKAFPINFERSKKDKAKEPKEPKKPRPSRAKAPSKAKDPRDAVVPVPADSVIAK